jgi:hypothetical protein
MTPIVLRTLASLMLASLPLVAAAQDVPSTVTMDGAVALQATLLGEGTLNEAQIAVLKDVAHQKAVVLTCDGFAIDEARFGGVFEAAYPTDAEFDAMDEAGQVQIPAVMMLVLGTFLGGNVAIAATDTPAWCASAEEERAQANAPNRIWAD